MALPGINTQYLRQEDVSQVLTEYFSALGGEVGEIEWRDDNSCVLFLERPPTRTELFTGPPIEIGRAHPSKEPVTETLVEEVDAAESTEEKYQTELRQAAVPADIPIPRDAVESSSQVFLAKSKAEAFVRAGKHKEQKFDKNSPLFGFQDPRGVFGLNILKSNEAFADWYKTGPDERSRIMFEHIHEENPSAQIVDFDKHGKPSLIRGVSEAQAERMIEMHPSADPVNIVARRNKIASIRNRLASQHVQNLQLRAETGDPEAEYRLNSVELTGAGEHTGPAFSEFSND